jgi:hypothetical protein
MGGEVQMATPCPIARKLDEHLIALAGKRLVRIGCPRLKVFNYQKILKQKNHFVES